MGQIVDANQGAAIMHGHTVEELKRLNIKDLDAPIDANKVEERVLPIFEGEWIKKEINHVRKDGSIFPVEISAGLLEIDHNNFILAIDRDIGERKKIEDRLKSSEKMGYSVSTGINGIEALDLFQDESNKFDLVITDMTMPKMTGDILATKLKAIKPDIPIIICTGYSKKMSNELAAEIGINAICYKPLSLKDLGKTIRKVLNK